MRIEQVFNAPQNAGKLQVKALEVRSARVRMS
jgi:hypothetical protein